MVWLWHAITYFGQFCLIVKILATFHFSLCILLPIMVKPFFLQVRSSPGFDYSDATCYVGAWLKHGWMSASVPSGLHLRVLMMAFMSVRSILGLGYFVPCALLQFCLARFLSTIYCYLYLWTPILSCGIFTLARFSIFAMLGLIRHPLQLWAFLLSLGAYSYLETTVAILTVALSLLQMCIPAVMFTTWPCQIYLVCLLQIQSRCFVFILPFLLNTP